MSPCPAQYPICLCVAAALALTGCVSNKYKTAPKDTPPAIALDLAAETPAARAQLRSVIIFKGPGSWKKEAYWDEYVITFVNHAAVPLTLESAELFDLDDAAQLPGTHPWKLEGISREKLKVASHTGRNIALGAGATLVWVGTAGAIAASTMVGGVTGGLAIAAPVVVLGLPVLAIGSGMRLLINRSDISQEFTRRRLLLPVAVPMGENISGSLFFPVTPGPRRLVLRYRTGDTAEPVTIDLAALAGLHLQPLPLRAATSPPPGR